MRTRAVGVELAGAQCRADAGVAATDRDQLHDDLLSVRVRSLSRLVRRSPARRRRRAVGVGHHDIGRFLWCHVRVKDELYPDRQRTPDELRCHEPGDRCGGDPGERVRQHPADADRRVRKACRARKPVGRADVGAHGGRGDRQSVATGQGEDHKDQPESRDDLAEQMRGAGAVVVEMLTICRANIPLASIAPRQHPAICAGM